MSSRVAVRKSPRICTTIVVSFPSVFVCSKVALLHPEAGCNGESGLDGIRCADLSLTAPFVWLSEALMEPGVEISGELLHASHSPGVLRVCDGKWRERCRFVCRFRVNTAVVYASRRQQRVPALVSSWVCWDRPTRCGPM